MYKNITSHMKNLSTALCLAGLALPACGGEEEGYEVGELASGLVDIGGSIKGSPSATVVTTYGSDTAVFARGSDDALWMSRGAPRRGFGSWTWLGGQLGSNPAAVSTMDGRIDVYARGSDSALWKRSLRGGMWSEWQSGGGCIAGEPAAATFARGTSPKVIVVAKGCDGRAWWVTDLTDVSPSFGRWQLLGGEPNGRLIAVQTSSREISVFMRDASSRLQRQLLSGSTWSGWRPFLNLISHADLGAASLGSLGSYRVDFLQAPDYDVFPHTSSFSRWGDGTPTRMSPMNAQEVNLPFEPPSVIAPSSSELCVFFRTVSSRVKYRCGTMATPTLFDWWI